MLAKNTFVVAFLCAVFNSALASHVSSNLHHRHLGLRLSDREVTPVVSPRALHRRCKPRHSVTPTTSSTPSPTPTSTTEQAPTTTWTPETTWSQTQAATTTWDQGNNNNNNNNNNNAGSSGGSSGVGFLDGTNSGQVTFYSTGLGACGITNVDTDYICAVSHALFDSYPGQTGNPNTNPVCNKKIIATVNGKEVTVTVTDRCEACAMTDLDFSPSAFNSVADPAAGRLGFTWRWA